MTSAGVLQIAIYFALILICAKPLGTFMARVFEGQRTFLHPVLRWLEVLTYKAAGVREDVEQLDAVRRVTAQLQHIRVHTGVSAAALAGPIAI
jgi:K+-transporting ATPase A subunit